VSTEPITEAWLKKRVWPRFARTRKEHRRIYLATHALGRPPDRMAQDVQHALDLWYHDMEGAWSDWLAARDRYRALVARLIGAKRPDCVVPKASAGQGLRAVLNALGSESRAKLRVVTSDGEFDSIDFVLRVYREKGRIDLRVMPWRELSLGNADLVVLSSVQCRTGEWIYNLPKFMRAAKTAGALVLLDLYHHAGVIPVDVAGLGVDFAVGGCAKYLRGRASPRRCARSIPAGSRRRSRLRTSARSRRSSPRAATPGSKPRPRCSRRSRRSRASR
jgi:kynureninase